MMAWDGLWLPMVVMMIPIEDWGIFRKNGSKYISEDSITMYGLYCILYIYAHTYTLSKSKHAVDGQQKLLHR